MQRRQFIATGAALTAFCPKFTHAQPLAGNAFIVSGFPSGGMGDYVSRPLAEKLRGKYASNMLVEAKPGAGGRIAIEYVRRATPTGSRCCRFPVRPWCSTPASTRS